MQINIKEHLQKFAQKQDCLIGKMVFCDEKISVNKIKVLMLNEVAPADPEDYFFSNKPQPAYMQTTKLLFGQAGIKIEQAKDLLKLGIYPTVAVKTAKSGYKIEIQTIQAQLPVLQEEISLFPNLQVVMLMGDVAKKAFNLLAKNKSGKNAVPAGSTYKIRKEQHYYNGLRIFPSYIMTGGNILIEKSKQAMVAEDITAMLKLL